MARQRQVSIGALVKGRFNAKKGRAPCVQAAGLSTTNKECPLWLQAAGCNNQLLNNYALALWTARESIRIALIKQLHATLVLQQSQ